MPSGADTHMHTPMDEPKQFQETRHRAPGLKILLTALTYKQY